MNLVLIIIAIVISFLVFTTLLKLVKTTITTALTVALILFTVQLAFGISSIDVLSAIGNFLQSLWNSLTRR